MYAYSGRAEQAIPHLEMALRLSPHDPYSGRYLAVLAEANFFVGRYQAAADLARTALRHPNLVHWSGHTALAAALISLGRDAEARSAADDLMRLRPDFSIKLLTQSIYMSDPECLERYTRVLKQAGLPE